jgi:hypothetical protein
MKLDPPLRTCFAASERREVSFAGLGWAEGDHGAVGAYFRVAVAPDCAPKALESVSAEMLCPTPPRELNPPDCPAGNRSPRELAEKFRIEVTEPASPTQGLRRT